MAASRGSRRPGFPARKTLEEFDFAFQSSLRRDSVLHLGQLDFLAGKENPTGLRLRNHRDNPVLGGSGFKRRHGVAFRAALTPRPGHPEQVG